MSNVKLLDKLCSHIVPTDQPVYRMELFSMGQTLNFFYYL